MNLWALLGWLLLALLFFWGVGAYNRLMKLRNAIGAAYVQLDQTLSARAAHCRVLLTLLRPRLANEHATFDALESAQAEAQTAAQAVRARPHAGEPVAALAVAAALHSAALTRLISLVEHHGELNGHAEIGGLVDELKLTGRQFAFARQLFNNAVEQYNAALQQMPTRLLISLYGFAPARAL